ncbi:MAG: M48 family metalloprotease [Candidatus Nitrohelix vancouverensis]|uniref:M48 family metalloprotease n=1 Tax=Candidatus Nitrohelix vancouverensis TaxID=2705534 RepID=A0A7T0C2U7_9BACT|nr:MAG: M48 family metalloprotease [Candidatus Nitrohelix vancouverensis]
MRARFLIFFTGLLIYLAGCASAPSTTCDPFQSDLCARGSVQWGRAIHRIVAANFPMELGNYKPVVHDAAFANAWVSSGEEIHVTLRLLDQMDEKGALCVVSHELAHLKSNHYHSKQGISVVTSAVMTAAGWFVPGLGYLDSLVNPALTNAFGREYELEADRLAVDYIRRAGLQKSDYLEFLQWMRDHLEDPEASESTSLFATHPGTAERISAIQEME